MDAQNDMITIEVPDSTINVQPVTPSMPQAVNPVRNQLGTSTPTVTSPVTPLTQTANATQGSIIQVPITPQEGTVAQSTERNEKGQFMQGNTASIGNHNSGRPTKYTEEIQKKADEYFNLCYGKKDKKQRLAFIEALALELDVDPDTLVEWKNAKNEDGSLKYPEFSATYKRIFTLQKVQLMTKGSSGKGQSFNQFLLSANHGMIPAEKKILAGDEKEPLHITIVEEDKDKIRQE